MAGEVIETLIIVSGTAERSFLRSIREEFMCRILRIGLPDAATGDVFASTLVRLTVALVGTRYSHRRSGNHRGSASRPSAVSIACQGGYFSAEPRGDQMVIGTSTLLAG